MIAAEVWSDGSCIFADRGRVDRGAGGWATVVERGSDGYVRRGRQPDTTSTRMEIVALTEGLRSLPAGVPTTCTVDCTVAIVVFDKWLRGELPWSRHHRDHDLWWKLAHEFDRRPVRFRLLERKERSDRHHRCHLIAKAEARSLAAGLPPPPLPGMQHTRNGWFLPPQLVRLQA